MNAPAPLVRVAAIAVGVAAALSVTVTVGAARERADLPAVAQHFLQATIDAGALSTCLQGSRDELYLPGQPPQLHNPMAVGNALARLRTCETIQLAGDLDALHLPPAAALTDRNRRLARADLVNGITILRRVVLDAAGARTALTREVRGASDGTAVVLAYRSADSGANAAYALADEALALLGHPQSTRG